MTENERTNTPFADAIERLFRAFNAKFSADTVANFRAHIGDVPPERIRAAVDEWISQKQKRVPKPWELNVIVKGPAKHRSDEGGERESCYVCNGCGSVVACSLMHSHFSWCEWYSHLQKGVPYDVHEVYLRGLAHLSPTAEHVENLKHYQNSKSAKR